MQTGRADRRGRRAATGKLGLLALCAMGPLALNYGAREAVAAAVAFAPNASKAPSAPLPLPPELLARGARSLETDVGPPAAKIVSWLVEPKVDHAKGTILLLHGVRMDKRSLVDVGVAISDSGYRAVLVDLRGHGESTGEYLTYGSLEAQDVSRVLDALPGSSGPVGVFGFSYGAATALQLSARDARVRAVVAVASFSSLREVTLDYERKYLPSPLRLIPDEWFQGAVDDAGRLAAFDPDRAAPVRAIEQSTAHVLLVHGSADTQVPLRHSRALERASAGRAELLVIPGATHDSMPGNPSVREHSVAWFDRWLSSRETPPAGPSASDG